MSRLQPAQPRLRRRLPRPRRCHHGCSPQRRRRPLLTACCARPILPGLVSGQIDRLVVTPGEVLIVDYKTNHAPPRTVVEAPRTYVRQLALYRAVLRKLYPRLPVRAALLWTETPELMEIYAPALDAQLAALSQGMSELDPATPRS